MARLAPPPQAGQAAAVQGLQVPGAPLPDEAPAPPIAAAAAAQAEHAAHVEDPAPAAAPPAAAQNGYTHVDISTAKMRIGDHGFEGRTRVEYDRVKAELEAANPGQEVTEREIRFEMIKRRVETASAKRAEHGGDETLGMFTAPEGALGENLTKQDAKWYRRQFKGLSAQHAHMAIMPGTMNWQERQKKQHGLGKKTALRTTGDVFYGGQRVHTVNKHKDAGDTAGQRVLHRPGAPAASAARAAKWYRRGRGPEDRGSTVNIGGVQIGYEICADHDHKRLRRELHDNPETALPDVHVLNAAGNAFDGKHAGLREGGIAISNNATDGVTTMARAGADYDREDETLMASAQTPAGMPAYLAAQVPLQDGQRRPLPPPAAEPEVDPYERERFGRFALPGR